jgi:inner membrane protein involved in colicin E2 resistance
MFQVLAIIVVLASFIILPIAMVRGLIQMRRDRSGSGTISSGVAGMMTEVDRLVRPSVEHVFEVKESAELQEDDVGGK